MSHTYTLLDVSQATYDEVYAKLEAAGYSQAFHQRSEGVVIDMHGITLAGPLVRQAAQAEQHHTADQVRQAFLAVPTILAELERLGIAYPSIQLYADASGTLWLGKSPTDEQLQRACELVRSLRVTHKPGQGSVDVGVEFCCGLVSH